MKKYYDILGLECDSSKEKIKSVYRKLSKIYHPDMQDTGNEKMFKNINEAFNKIKNNDFECGEYSGNNDYQEKKENNHGKEYNANYNKNYYRDATSGIVTGFFDGLAGVFMSILKINFFSRILNYIKPVLGVVLFVYNSVIRLFSKYRWKSIFFILVWPLGLILLFLELFGYSDLVEKKEFKSLVKWIIRIFIIISIAVILAGVFLIENKPKERIYYMNIDEKIKRLEDMDKSEQLVFGSLINNGMSIEDAMNSIERNRKDNIIFGRGGFVENILDKINK